MKVNYPGLSDTFVSDWAPCARPMAGKDMGFYALPEMGEQVLVAFENGDLNHPYVLGSLWTAQRHRRRQTDGHNNKRVIKPGGTYDHVRRHRRRAGKLTISEAGRPLDQGRRPRADHDRGGGQITDRRWATTPPDRE